MTQLDHFIKESDDEYLLKHGPYLGKIEQLDKNYWFGVLYYGDDEVLRVYKRSKNMVAIEIMATIAFNNFVTPPAPSE